MIFVTTLLSWTPITNKLLVCTYFLPISDGFCASALPAADLELSLVDFERITLDAFVAAIGSVVLEFVVMANLLS